MREKRSRNGNKERESCFVKGSLQPCLSTVFSPFFPSPFYIKSIYSTHIPSLVLPSFFLLKPLSPYFLYPFLILPSFALLTLFLLPKLPSHTFPTFICIHLLLSLIFFAFLTLYSSALSSFIYDLKNPFSLCLSSLSFLILIELRVFSPSSFHPSPHAWILSSLPPSSSLFIISSPSTLPSPHHHHPHLLLSYPIFSSSLLGKFPAAAVLS